MLKPLFSFLFVAAMSATLVLAQPRQEPARDAYVPVDQLPPSEQMPSAPYVIAAYAVVWIVAMFYIWTIWQRIGRVEADMAALAKRQKDRGR